MLNVHRYILVTWMDACSPSTGGWVEPEDIDDLLEPQVFETVGMVVSENDLVLVVASSVDHVKPIGNQMGGLTAIPKSCILNQTPLETPTPK